MVLEAPNRLESYDDLGITFFLAGTIDNGESLDWQKEISDYSNEIGVNVFNPRRNNWDKDAGSKEIVRQIDWELEHMEKADYIISNFSLGTWSSRQGRKTNSILSKKFL